MFLLSHFHGDSARKDVLSDWKKKEKRESGWDNHQTVGRKETTAKKYGYAPHTLLKPTLFKNELEKMEGLSAQIEYEKVHYFNQPKPMPSYFSIAASLGLIHHDNTDVNKELEVVKRIIVRESLLLTLEMLCRKLVRWEALQRTTTDLENDLLLTLADMRERTVEYIDALIVWRESAINYDPLNPRIFYWEQRNYTLKITKDLNFLAEQPLFVNALGIPLEKIKTNPLMLPNTLEETEVTWIDPVKLHLYYLIHHSTLEHVTNFFFSLEFYDTMYCIEITSMYLFSLYVWTYLFCLAVIRFNVRLLMLEV